MQPIHMQNAVFTGTSYDTLIRSLITYASFHMSRMLVLTVSSDDIKILIIIDLDVIDKRRRYGAVNFLHDEGIPFFCA